MKKKPAKARSDPVITTAPIDSSLSNSESD